MSKRVVIVDDSKFVRNQLKHFMEVTMGFDVVALGENGQEAVDLYIQHKPDLMTLDLTMPIKDGSIALQEISEIDPESRVVVITAIINNEMNSFLAEHAAAVIEKPMKLRDSEYVSHIAELFNEVLEIEMIS